MSDFADAASDIEQQHRDRALQQAAAVRSSEAPLEQDGVRLCLDCHDPIVAARLAAQPTAVRCTECQAYNDRGTR